MVPTLKCAEGELNNYSRFTVEEQLLENGSTTNGDLKYPIALLSADELVMAGVFKTYENKSYYLYSDWINSLEYTSWYTMTPSTNDSKYSNVFSSSINTKSLEYVSVGNIMQIRPVINLKSDILWTGGDGTNTNSYTIGIIN